jgi:hypothetical protein
MMRRSAATLLLLLATTPALISPVLAGERGPVCRLPSVVEEMTRQIRAQNYYARTDPRLITEQPTADPRFVRCDVCVLAAPYDTVRFGDRPIPYCAASAFEILILTNGFVVRALR